MPAVALVQVDSILSSRTHHLVVLIDVTEDTYQSITSECDHYTNVIMVMIADGRLQSLMIR